jgi:propanediol dehydratase small subunit
MTQVYVGSAAMSKSRALGLTITPDPRVLNVGLAARPYHESMITK